MDSDSPADDDKADSDKADEVKAGDVDDGQDGDAAEPTDGASDGDAPPVAGDEDTPPADATPAQDDSVQPPASHDSADPQVASRSARTHPSARLHTTDVDTTVTAADKVEVQPQTVSLDAVADVPTRRSVAQSSAEAFTASATTLTSAVPVPSTPKQRPTLVKAVSDFVAAVLQPLLSPAKGSPIQMPILSALLSLVRNEFERIFAPRKANVAPQQTVALLTDPPNPVTDPTQQHVLVIGVDGTNLSRILADDYNQNFFDLMDTSTTAAASIVGHTTISNPSWTAILTGVWGERTGVINNVFTPWTYDKFPTVFNQLETLNPAIGTMAVGDWDVINAIAGAGSVPADKNVFVPQFEGDTNWLETDDAVADKTVDAISGVNGTTPNFLFSYFVGVDENGHMYGGASPQYAAAIRNMDDNLGEILDAVDAREAATGEDWTVIVVTDHGHMAQKGFGHGFQSPDETATFVIADGPDFRDGYINPKYAIVDTTPTVVSLFGGTPLSGSDGVPLTTLGGSDVDPVDLKQALEDAIAHERLSPLRHRCVSGPAHDLRHDPVLRVHVRQRPRRGAAERHPRAGEDPLRRPVRGDECPGADRRLADRRDRRPHLPAVATGAARVPAGRGRDPAGLRPPGLRPRRCARIGRRVMVRRGKCRVKSQPYVPDRSRSHCPKSGARTSFTSTYVPSKGAPGFAAVSTTA